jgi:hypothetical protein
MVYFIAELCLRKSRIRTIASSALFYAKELKKRRG